MIALNAIPSRQDEVKSLTRTPGYLAVERLAHRNSTSFADTFGSCPTTISEICNKMKRISKNKVKFIKYVLHKCVNNY